MAEGRFKVDPVGSYSLEASVRFLEGFAPASYEGAGVDHLRLAFVADGGEAVAGVYAHPEGNGVIGEVFGEAETGVVREQVARIF